MQAMEISLTGLDVEWRRLEVIADNLANIGATRTASGAPFQAQRLVNGPRGQFARFMGTTGTQALSGTAAFGLEPTATPPRRVYEPAHPHADAEGYVSYPGVDHAAEMALMLKTARAYEANIVALNLARQMYAKALELGRR